MIRRPSNDSDQVRCSPSSSVALGGVERRRDEHRLDVPGREGRRAHSPSSWMASSRMRYFWTLPVTVIGKESTIFQ